MRAVILTILLASTIWSCGSRKVSKSTTKSDLVVVDSSRLTAELKSLKLENTFYKNLYKNMKLRADSIISDGKGNLKLYAPVVEAEESGEEFKNDFRLDSKVNIEDSDNLKVDEKKTDFGKDVDKKQFNWWQVILPVMSGLLIFLGIKRFAKKRRLKALKK